MIPPLKTKFGINIKNKNFKANGFMHYMLSLSLLIKFVKFRSHFPKNESYRKHYTLKFQFIHKV